MGDKMNEIFKRSSIMDDDRHIGYVTARYPMTENKRIDKYYTELAQTFIKRAEKYKLTGMLGCSVTYEDDEFISIITEARLYKDTECIRRHRSSFVWNRIKGRLRYIKKRGMRYSNITYDGRELKKFD